MIFTSFHSLSASGGGAFSLGAIWRALGLFAALTFTGGIHPDAQAVELQHPILYVTQVPVKETENTVVSIGGSHRSDPRSAPRGGDVMILYPGGKVRNLTREAGYGETGEAQNTPKAIAVRDPAVHWSGKRALFSMVVGAPTDANDLSEFYWQIYEITGLGEDESPVIEWVSGQSPDFNNIQPTYTSSEDEVIFVSDSTLDKRRGLYPVHDELGKGYSVTGLWRLNRRGKTTELLEHSPSGSFHPFVDSFGRIVFSRWDHLQQDDKANPFHAQDFYDESLGAEQVPVKNLYPEPVRSSGKIVGHTFDLFLPWTINQDGTGLLTMNHLGRHELSLTAKRARKDENLIDFTSNADASASLAQATRASSYLQISENPGKPGNYLATDAVSTAVSAGRVVALNATPETNPDKARVTVANNTGLVRDPRILEDGRMIGSFASGPILVSSYGGPVQGPVTSTEIPKVENPFKVRVSKTEKSAGLQGGGTPTPTNKVRRINTWKAESSTFSGELWELQPQEVINRGIPDAGSEALPYLETKVFNDSGVSMGAMKAWLKQNDLALVVSRNLTARDGNDRQQPYNLYVPGGVASIIDGGPSYEITHLQFFQGDYVRSFADEEGRRAVPRLLHDDKGANLPNAVPSSAEIAPDGSTAMIVPARRALTWQTTDREGEPVVRERYWLSFKAGEIRTCTACHGTNSSDQVGRPEQTNPPMALRKLLDHWKGQHEEANTRLSPFGLWAGAHGIDSAVDRNADTDGDGLSLLEEFVYGDHPEEPFSSDGAAKPLSGEIISEGGQTQVRLRFTHRSGEDLRISLESSRTLRSWTEEVVVQGKARQSSASFEVRTGLADSAQREQGLELIEMVSRRSLVDDPPRYYRLRIQE